MSFRLVSEAYSVRITPALAQAWADMAPVPQDRPYNDTRAAKHRASHGAGKLRPVLWATVKCLENGETYRANGKHTSTMFGAMTQEQIDLPAGGQTAVVESYEADTLVDVAELYNTFDSRAQTRNQGDINRALSATVSDFDGYDFKLLNLIASAIAMADNPNGYNHISPEERGHALIDPNNREVITWLHSILSHSGVGTRDMRRVPVMAAMVATYRVSTNAVIFWRQVRDEEGQNADSPVRKLAKFLLTAVVNRGGGVGSSRYRTGPREFYVKCIHAWNAFRTGVETNLAYHANKPIPKVL
jgi:hypothetical protein